MPSAPPQRWLALPVMAFGLACAVAPAPGSGQAGKDDLPAFSLATTMGETRTGPLVSLSADGTVRVGGDKSAPLKVDNWLTLRKSKTALAPQPRGPQVVLTTGDRLGLAEKGGIRLVDNRLHLEPRPNLGAVKTPLAVPLSRVVVLWLGGPDEADKPPFQLQQLVRGSRKKDIVLLRNGDKIEGNVLALDSGSNCRVGLGKKHVDLPWPSVGAIAFSTELLAGKPPAGVYFHLVLADGDRICVESCSLPQGGKALAAMTLFGAAVEVPLAQLIAVDVRHGAAVYLSDLKPRKFEHTPFLGTTWPLVTDGSATGGDLCLAGSTFDKGLGMHAESRVNYDLDAQFRWFEATVGLDPEHGKQGRVRIRVLVDGKARDLGWNKELTASDGPLTMRLDVRQGRELTLEVLFGGYGDVQAHVNWVDARLIKN